MFMSVESGGEGDGSGFLSLLRDLVMLFLFIAVCVNLRKRILFL